MCDLELFWKPGHVTVYVCSHTKPGDGVCRQYIPYAKNYEAETTFSVWQ